jgi:hypothetical protein
LTAFNFPGQTLHHGALLVDDGKNRVLFVGDSFTQSGMDNYCPQNRNFWEGNRGFSYCLDVIEKVKPTALIHQHHDAFIFTPAIISVLRNNIAERLPLLKEITPWSALQVALDPQWLRVFPYYNFVSCGEKYTFQLQVTSHWEKNTKLVVKFTATEGIAPPQDITINLSGLTSGFCASTEAPDTFISLSIDVPENFSRESFAIGCHAWVDDQYWGEMSKGIFKIQRP